MQDYSLLHAAAAAFDFEAAEARHTSFQAEFDRQELLDVEDAQLASGWAPGLVAVAVGAAWVVTICDDTPEHHNFITTFRPRDLNTHIINPNVLVLNGGGNRASTVLNSIRERFLPF